MLEASIIFWIASSSFAPFTVSCLRFNSFWRTSSLYSSSVSNSDMSETNSSFNSGISFALIAWIFTWNTAGFPASSCAWYCSGKVTCTSASSPAFFPISCSSKVSIKEWEPISREWFSPLPPSNGLPSTNPSKSMMTVSPSATGRSVTSTVRACLFLVFSISASTSSSVTTASAFVTVTPLYSPKTTSGFTATSAVNTNSFPFSTCVTSISGRDTISSPLSSIACGYSSLITIFAASS